MTRKAYENTLETFHSSILKGDATPALPLITDKPDFPRAAQMAIYFRNYRSGLKKAVAEDFPALKYALGDTAFDALAEGYVASTPSRHFNLDRYPYGFPAYVTRQCDDGFARDVAALEGAIAEVYAMEESPAVETEWLAAIDAATLADTRLLPRRACRLLSLTYPVNGWLSAFREQKNPERPALRESHVAVWRHLHNVKRRDMEPLEFQLFSRLGEGRTVGAALEGVALPRNVPPETFLADIRRWFAEWVRAGMMRSGTSSHNDSNKDPYAE